MDMSIIMITMMMMRIMMIIIIIIIIIIITKIIIIIIIIIITSSFPKILILKPLATFAATPTLGFLYWISSFILFLVLNCSSVKIQIPNDSNKISKTLNAQESLGKAGISQCEMVVFSQQRN